MQQFSRPLYWPPTTKQTGSLTHLFLVEFLALTLKVHTVSNQYESDQTPHVAASDLVLHCVPMSYKTDARHLRVKSANVIRLLQRTILRAVKSF